MWPLAKAGIQLDAPCHACSLRKIGQVRQRRTWYVQCLLSQSRLARSTASGLSAMGAPPEAPGVPRAVAPSPEPRVVRAPGPRAETGSG